MSKWIKKGQKRVKRILDMGDYTAFAEIKDKTLVFVLRGKKRVRIPLIGTYWFEPRMIQDVREAYVKHNIPSNADGTISKKYAEDLCKNYITHYYLHYLECEVSEWAHKTKPQIDIHYRLICDVFIKEVLEILFPFLIDVVTQVYDECYTAEQSFKAFNKNAKLSGYDINYERNYPVPPVISTSDWNDFSDKTNIPVTSVLEEYFKCSGTFTL